MGRKHLLCTVLTLFLGTILAPAGALSSDLGSLNPDAPPRTAEFDFLVGEWLAHITVPRPDTDPITATADWTIGYIMDGWALRDDWFVTLADGTIANFGTMFRTFDAAHERWTIVEQTTPEMEFTFMTAAPEGETMVMFEHAEGFDGPLTGKRVFSRITPDSFLWRHFRTSDGGETWVPGAWMEVVRKKATASE